MRIVFIVVCFTLQAWSCAAVVHLNDMFGEIKSPDYPNKYDDNQNMTWQITAPTAHQVVLYFSVFDLEDSYDEDLGGSCVYDFVEIQGLGKSKRLCGNSKYYPYDAPRAGERFRSQDNVMTIRFVSDYSNEDPRPLGFRAHYIIEDKDECAQMRYDVEHTYEDWDELIYCNHFCNNVPGSYYCSCRPGFVLHENQHTCKAMCENQVITSDSGEIQSPDFPKPYSRLTDCDWTIQVREGLSINIMFNSTFDIEDHFNYTECVYDYLQLTYSGSSQKYCGRNDPFNGTLMETNVRQLRLDFHTDNAIENAGFKMSYTTNKIKCLDNRAAPRNGRISSRNRKGFYELDDRIEFVCNRGYNLAGQNMIVCQSDGKWDAASPVCQIKSCGDPTFLREVAYSTIDGIDELDFTYRDVARVRCNQWYERVSGAARWICSEEGTWKSADSSNTAAPVCRPECGEKSVINRGLLVPLVAGGNPTLRHEWPWMVFLNFGVNININTPGYYCGGALISPQYVLTAAHCVTTRAHLYPPDGIRYASEIHVWVAAHNRIEDNMGHTPARSVAVAEVIRHPQYNDTTKDNDIALLRLDETLIMNNNIRPICIPETEEKQNLLIPDTFGTVAGWGLNSRFGAASVLQEASIPVVNHTACRAGIMQTADDLNKILINFLLTDNMFCSGFSQGQIISTCGGDSGGSWMLEHDHKFYSFGIVSFGIAQSECGVTATYTVFTKLANYIDWIRNNSDLD